MKKYILIICLILVFLNGCIFPKNCGTDLNCFEEYAVDCSRARVNVEHEGNNIRITLRGITDEGCKVSFKLEEFNEEIKQKYPTEVLIAKGKTMNCVIPLKEDYYDEISKIEESFDKYCSGPVKEALPGPLKGTLKLELEKFMS